KTKAREEVLEMMRTDINIKLEKGWSGGRPGAFHVGYSGPNPELVTEVANQIANLFIDENLRTRERQAEGTADFIDGQLNEAKKKLDELEAKVSQWKLQHNGELPQQETALSASRDRLQVELQGNQDALNRTQQDKILLQTSLNLAEAAEAALARWNEPVAGGASRVVKDENGNLVKQPARSSQLQEK